MASLAVAGSISEGSLAGPAHGLVTAGMLTTDLLEEPLVVEAGTMAPRDLGDLRVNDEAIRAATVGAYGMTW